MKKLLFTVLVAVLLYGCVKDQWLLDNQTQIPNLDPSFAIPLIDTELNLSKMQVALDNENFIYNGSNETFALVYRGEVLHYSSAQLKYFQSWAMNYAHNLTNTEANSLSTLPTGSGFSISSQQMNSIPLIDDETIDSVTFGGGNIDITFSSMISHHHEVTVTIPDLTLSGVPFSQVVSFDYLGSVPFGTSVSFPLSGYTLDLTENGSTSNSVSVDFNVNFTSTGNLSNPGDALGLIVSIDPTQYQTIWGYMGQHAPLSAEGSQNINLFKNYTDGLMHFKNPYIAMTFFNSTGVPINAEFDMIYAPENSVEQSVTGGDLSNLPLIEAAQFVGDTAATPHLITNESTTPNLNLMLEEGPFTIYYSNTISINPQGPTNNFLTDSGKVICRADLVLPFWGFAGNFTLMDSLDLDLAEALAPQNGDVLTLDDIDKVTLRMIVDNGLPLDVGAQVYFADSLGNLLDSVFVGGPFETIFQSGYVDFSLPPNDVNYGRVLSSTKKTTDFVLTGQKIKDLIDQGSKKMIVKSVATIESIANTEFVRFYPEYSIGMKISAKIDTHLNLSE